MRILLVEDDSATTRSIELALAPEGFDVHSTDLGEEAIDLGKHNGYDIIILSLGLPDISGFEVLRSLRANKVKTPILILSGLGGIDAESQGRGLGSDDYMTKPFHRDALVARIHAVVRRHKDLASCVIRTGDLAVNRANRSAEVQGQRIHLTGKQFQILELLSLRRDRAVKREELLRHLYDGADAPELDIIDVFIARLQKKIADASGDKNFIVFAEDDGYRLVDPDGG